MPHKGEMRKRELDDGYWTADTGDLTYVLYRDAVKHLPGEPSFEDLSDVIAAFECAKLEFVRLYLVPFEEKAIQRNGEACR